MAPSSTDICPPAAPQHNPTTHVLALVPPAPATTHPPMAWPTHARPWTAVGTGQEQTWKTVEITQPGEEGWIPVAGSSLMSTCNEEIGLSPSCSPRNPSLSLSFTSQLVLPQCWIAAPAQTISLARNKQTPQNQQATSPKPRVKPANLKLEKRQGKSTLFSFDRCTCASS